MVFDKIMERLNEVRARQDYSIIDDINQNTKANIVQSMLGLGHIFREQAFTELLDMPTIVNYLEKELRYMDMRIEHKQRGQHPMAYQREDLEIMTTNILTNTTERLRNPPFARMTGMENELRRRREMTVEEGPMTRYAVMRGEPIHMRPSVISSGSDEETT